MRALATLLMAVIMLALGAVSHATEDFLAITNADRSRNGLAPLTMASDLQAYAQGWAEEMMRAGQISHSPNLVTVTDSRLVGENVGQGRILADIQSAFMASPAHRANILRPDFSEAGVGVVWDGVKHFYVAVIFRQAKTTAPPPAAVETKPAPAPATLKAKPSPAPRPISGTPTTDRPEPAPAPPPVRSPSAAVPPPRPAPKPARVAQPVPVAREAGSRLSWALAATTGKSVSAADDHSEASPALQVAASSGPAAKNGSSPPLLMAVAFLGMVCAWTRILAEAHQRFVSSVRP